MRASKKQERLTKRMDVKSSIAINVNGLIVGEGKGIDTTTISVSSVEVFAIASPSKGNWESFFLIFDFTLSSSNLSRFHVDDNNLFRTNPYPL